MKLMKILLGLLATFVAQFSTANKSIQLQPLSLTDYELEGLE